jgi:flagellar basal body rod protein FlgB
MRKLFLVLILLASMQSWGRAALLFDDTMYLLEQNLKETVNRQNIIAHNLANAKNPDFVPVRYEDELKEIMSRPGFKMDQVNTEEEMTKMTKNRYKHQSMVRLMNLKYEVLRKVISQGR